jgi:hypothetical protein
MIGFISPVRLNLGSLQKRVPYQLSLSYLSLLLYRISPDDLYFLDPKTFLISSYLPLLTDNISGFLRILSPDEILLLGIFSPPTLFYYSTTIQVHD